MVDVGENCSQLHLAKFDVFGNEVIFGQRLVNFREFDIFESKNKEYFGGKTLVNLAGFF